MDHPPCILTIAGSDSGGGAGIQADLKTITMLGGYGASVITALTAQNSRAVEAIHAPPPSFVARQLEAVLGDMAVDAAKTGMLFSAPIIEAVVPLLRKKKYPLVVDPVCVAASGARLLKPEATQAMAEKVFPLADLLTPNKFEAELFTGMTISDNDDVAEACAKLLEMGPKAVLLKGGHLDSVSATDWFATRGQSPIPFIQPRVDTPNVHGTGCTLSAAIATGLGLGLPMGKAIQNAQRYLNLGLRASFAVGKGGGPVHHSVLLEQLAAREPLLDELADLGRSLVGLPGLFRLIPEIRMNVALAAPYADAIDDVAAFTGRITCTRQGEVIVAGRPAFGASSHMAKVLLAARRVRPEVGCCCNILLTKQTLKAVELAGLNTAWFDRADEPDHVKNREGGSLEWGTSRALSEHPDPSGVNAVCDWGEEGKEPVCRILAEDSRELLDLLEAVLRRL